MATKSPQARIKELLEVLGKSTDQQEKRVTRKELRSLGHKGGLNQPRKKAKKAKKTKKKKKAKKVSNPGTEE